MNFGLVLSLRNMYPMIVKKSVKNMRDVRFHEIEELKMTVYMAIYTLGTRKFV